MPRQRGLGYSQYRGLRFGLKDNSKSSLLCIDYSMGGIMKANSWLAGNGPARGPLACLYADRGDVVERAVLDQRDHN